jgi:hypothetical protein
MEISRIFSIFSCRASKPQALPPQYQEAREREAIQNDPRLSEFLGNAEILEIRKVEGGYVVVTDAYEMQVDVHYLPLEKNFCGPAKFELSFSQPVPR